jgi:hypothetical protein
MIKRAADREPRKLRSLTLKKAGGPQPRPTKSARAQQRRQETLTYLGVPVCRLSDIMKLTANDSEGFQSSAAVAEQAACLVVRAMIAHRVGTPSVRCATSSTTPVSAPGTR